MDPDYVENALEEEDVLLRVLPPPCQRVCDHELFWDAGCTDAAAPAHTPCDQLPEKERSMEGGRQSV